MRRCPFHGCDQVLPDYLFACRPHWFSLNAKERAEIHAAYDDYMADEGAGVETLRQRQQAVLGTRGTA